MAQKRMFDKSVIRRDDFIEMPDSTQNLYFHLSMDADDDGFVDNWKSLMRMTGKKEDDLKLLIAKNFVIPFDTGVIVIKHWRMNNYLRKDRYHETKYSKELATLTIEDNEEYSLGRPKVAIDKNSIEENSIDKSSLEEISIDKSSYIGEFQKPTISELEEYLKEKKYNNISAEKFFNYYKAKNWMLGKTKMNDWKSVIEIWHSNEFKNQEPIPEYANKNIETEKATVEEQLEIEAMLGGLYE